MSAAFIALGMPALAAYNPSSYGYGARSSGPEPEGPWFPEEYEIILFGFLIALCGVMGWAILREITR
jgi:hypothetical protein